MHPAQNAVRSQTSGLAPVTPAAEPAPPSHAVPEVAPAGERDALDLLCFRNLMAASHDIIYFKDRQSRYLRVSGGTARSYGQDDPRHLEGRSDADHYTADHAHATAADEARIMHTGIALVDVEERQHWPGRPDTFVSSTKLPLRDAENRVVGTFGVSRDISARMRAEDVAQRATDELTESVRELRRVEADLRRVLEVSPDAIVRVDSSLRWTYVNTTALDIIARPEPELLGRRTEEIEGLNADFLACWVPALQRVATLGSSAEIDFELPHESGPRWFQSRMVPEVGPGGTVDGVLTVTRDLTALKRAERLLEHQASHDALTGLLNRPMLLESLRTAVVRLRRHPSRLAVLFIDLDDFKSVNDTFGHAEGDRVLVEVARRLKETCRAHDVVARFGGDEFVVVCEGFLTEAAVEVVASRISDGLSIPFRSGDFQLTVRASVGVATTTEGSLDPATLIRQADGAMYHAKHGGGGAYVMAPAIPTDAPGLWSTR